MANSIHLTKLAVCLSVFTLLSACGGGAGGVDAQGEPPADASVVTGTAEYTPTPGNGLEIAYADGVVDDGSQNTYIDAQWAHMQTCLQVSAQEPVVQVIEGKIEPEDSTDDVIRHIDGQILASSHVTDTSATIMIQAQDFDGSVGNPGHNLRSIMGRYLWLANSLDERDYPYNCAADG